MRISDWSSDVCSSDLNNLDEFFMVRVAGLKGQQLQDVDLPSADGLTPTQQLQAIAADADRLITDQQRAWHAIYGELARAGIEVVGEGSMDTSAEAWLEKHFLTQVFPIQIGRAHV